MPTSMLRNATIGLGALALGIWLSLGAPGWVTAQEIEVIRPDDPDPDDRVDVNGSLISITHVEDAEQADAVFFEDERDRYERDANDPMARPYGLFLTSDMTGEPTYIVLDLSWLRDEDNQQFVDLMVFDPDGSAERNVPGTHESAQLLLHPQRDGTYLAREYRELAKGSQVNNTDWGIHEPTTTRDDSIDARVHNVPDDDEALNQGDRFDHKGRRVDDDD